MNLQDLLDILNPIETNKYTRYQSRKIRYALGREWWTNGKDSYDKIRFNFLPKSGGGWKLAGTFEQDDIGISRIILYDDNVYSTIEEVRELLKDTPVKVVLGKRPQ